MLDSCRHLEMEGFRVTYLPVQANGLIELEQLERAITPQTSLCSVMTVNNEIGVRQPVEEIGTATGSAGRALVCWARDLGFDSRSVPLAVQTASLPDTAADG